MYFCLFRAIFLGLLLQAVFSNAWSMRLHFFDVDGTLFHDSGLSESEKKPAWWSYWVLRRIPSVNNGLGVLQAQSLLEQGLLPEVIYLNKNEIDRYRERFATRNERMGNVAPVTLDKDVIQDFLNYPLLRQTRPLTIYPGYYLIDESTAYELHRDSELSDSPFLKTLNSAILRMKADPSFDLRGPAFQFFREALENQSEDERVYYLTDRDHVEKSFRDMTFTLYREGLIGYPEKDIIKGEGHLRRKTLFAKPLSASALDARLFGSTFEFDARKAGIVLQKALKLPSSPRPKDWVIGADLNDAENGTRRQMHEIIVYENRPDYIAKLIQSYRQYAAILQDVKLIIYRAGQAAKYDSHVAITPRNSTNLETKNWYVFSSTGAGLRYATDQELADLHPKFKKNKKSDVACNMFNKNKRPGNK